MLLIQTAFAQERTAVLKAGRVTHRDKRFDRVVIANIECQVIMTGIGPRAAQLSMQRALSQGSRPECVLSVGLAGALRPAFSCGHQALIRHVARHGQEATVAAHLERLDSNLLDRMGVYALVTLQQAAFTKEHKAELARQCGADLCDMETHAVATQCVAAGVPWIGARVVSDRATESLPAWMIRLPTLVEQKRWSAVCRLLATHPQDVPGLIGLAFRMQRLQRQLTRLAIDLVTHVRPA